jgi:uncharacterized UPF0146 family protein
MAKKITATVKTLSIEKFANDIKREVERIKIQVKKYDMKWLYEVYKIAALIYTLQSEAEYNRLVKKTVAGMA